MPEIAIALIVGFALESDMGFPPGAAGLSTARLSLPQKGRHLELTAA